MQLLLIGGAGRVGRMITPYLAERHHLRVLDLAEPAEAGADHLRGDLTDPAVVSKAVAGVDAVLFLAMGPLADWESTRTAAAHFDVSVKGLYIALRCAAEAGVRQIVHTSSMSVYATAPGERYPSEDVPPDAHRFYGLAKSCGEQVCRAAAEAWELGITALRLSMPTEQEIWERGSVLDPIATSAADTARAYLAALEQPRQGFRAYAISGDTSGRHVNVTRADRELGWRALDRHSPEQRPLDRHPKGPADA